MKLIDQIFEACGSQIPMRELRLFGRIADASRLEQLKKMENPDEFEHLYHEEQSITAGEYFWLWVRYIENKIVERDNKINEGHRDEVLPLDEFVRGLNAPPAILCEVFFRGDSCNADYKFPGYCGCIQLGREFENSRIAWNKATFDECTFEDYLRWFSSGVMQFVRTIWEYNIPFRIAPDYRFLVVYEARIPEICQAMIDAVKKGKLSPERFSFGFLNMPDTRCYFEQIQNEHLFQGLPTRLLNFCTDYGPFNDKPWGDFCSILPTKAQTQNLPKDAVLADFCAKCVFPCNSSITHIRFDWDDFDLYFDWEDGPDIWTHRETNQYSGWCLYENFAYVKFDYVCSRILKNYERDLYIRVSYHGTNNPILDQQEHIRDLEYQTNLQEYQANLQAEEEDRLYNPEYYHPGKRFGRRHHGGGGSAHKTTKTVLDLPTLEKRIQAAFKKWDKELKPLVQTVAFLTNHGLNVQGRDLSTWQAAADWLFEVKEKRLSEAVAKMETSQMLKLAELCGRLSWQKLRDLLAEPIKQCKGECVAHFKGLIHGMDEPHSNDAEDMPENKLFAQVYRLAAGWSKIC